MGTSFVLVLLLCSHFPTAKNAIRWRRKEEEKRRREWRLPMALLGEERKGLSLFFPLLWVCHFAEGIKWNSRKKRVKPVWKFLSQISKTRAWKVMSEEEEICLFVHIQKKKEKKSWEEGEGASLAGRQSGPTFSSSNDGVRKGSSNEKSFFLPFFSFSVRNPLKVPSFFPSFLFPFFPLQPFGLSLLLPPSYYSCP